MAQSVVFPSNTQFDSRCNLCELTGTKLHPPSRCPLICLICRCLDKTNYHQTKDHRCNYCDLIGGKSHCSENCPNKPTELKKRVRNMTYPPILDAILSENGWDY